MNLYLLVQITVSGLALASVVAAGPRKIVAWPLLIAAHALFLGYSAVTHQWGFWPLNLGMIAAAAINWRTWLQQPATMGGVIGYIIAGPNRHSRMEGGAHGVVYATREAGEAELRELREDYPDWSLCALVPVGPPVGSRGADEKVS